MAKLLEPLDIDDRPELARLVEQVSESRQALPLKRHGKSIAMLVPIKPVRTPRQPQVLSQAHGDFAILPPCSILRGRGKVVTGADIEAALSAFGGWKDLMDPEEFKRERRELQVHDREPREP
ncbi:MAG: hypothetical protein ACR2PL_07265 [Dehalococcoidia bacterium]